MFKTVLLILIFYTWYYSRFERTEI